MVLKVVKFLTASVIAIVALSLFIYAYNYTGVHITNTTGATDYSWESNQLISNMTEGFSWIHMDSDGFNNSYNSDSDSIDILLMGSSHMEAMNVGETENLGYLLNETLPEMYTYNIGISGHSIYTCVQNMNDAREQYNPQKYVVLETATIELDEEIMQEVLEGKYGEIKSYDSGMLYLVQKYIPAVKNIYNDLSSWIDIDPVLSEQSQDTSSTEDSEGLTSSYITTLDNFLKKAAADAGTQLIIFYHPSHSIATDGTLLDDTDDDYKSAFENACLENGIIFVDLTEKFEELYENEHKLTHGFINTSIGSGHLNKYGHQIASEAIADVIRGIEYGIE